MSIVDTKRNGTALVDFAVEDLAPTAAAPRVSNVEVPLSAEARESVSSHIARFFAALRHSSTIGKNGFMLRDRAVYEEFRASAARQAMVER
jgi:hypothetical protein